MIRSHFCKICPVGFLKIKFEISIKVCILRTKMLVVIKYHIFLNLRMQILKKWRSLWKTFFNKHFKNIIWHHLAGESHQVVPLYSMMILAFVCMGPYLLCICYCGS
jgi:hypothetical protein